MPSECIVHDHPMDQVSRLTDHPANDSTQWRPPWLGRISLQNQKENTFQRKSDKKGRRGSPAFFVPYTLYFFSCGVLFVCSVQALRQKSLSNWACWGRGWDSWPRSFPGHIKQRKAFSTRKIFALPGRASSMEIIKDFGQGSVIMNVLF